MRRKRRNNDGYVLLLVLLVLAVAGTVMTAAVRDNCRRASTAHRRLGELRRYWAIRSLREVCLPEAAEHLAGPETEYRCTVTLDGTDYRVVLCDEQVKANVNRLATRRSRADLHILLARLQERVRRPLTVDLQPGRRFGTYSSFDQVFADADPARLIDPDNAADMPTRRITFWGDGTVNFRRAGEPVLRAVLDGRVGLDVIANITSFTEDNPTGGLDELVEDIEPTDTEERVLRDALTDRSRAFALWIIAAEEARDRYALFLRQADEDGRTVHRRGYTWP